jgi:signal transduction histidine kinase
MTKHSTPTFPGRVDGLRLRADRLGATAVAQEPPGALRPLASRREGTPRLVFTAVLLTALYIVAGKLGLMLGLIHPSASAVWAPTGIAIAALLILGQRMWPGIFVGAFVVNATTAGTLLTSLGVATGNTLEALLGAALVDRFANGRHAFLRPQDTFKFAFLAGMLSPVVSASFGVASLSLGGFAPWSEFGSIWLTWWLGDMGGALVVAPLLVLWINDPHLRWSRAQAAEAAAIFAALLATGLLVFGSIAPQAVVGQSLKFLCMPLLVWAAFRFDQRITVAACFEISAVAVGCTVMESSRLGRESVNESLMVLQVFVAVAAVTTLALAAVVGERRRMHAAERATKDELREALAELEAFKNSIQHDLRQPVGALVNYSAILLQDYEGRLDESGTLVVRKIRASASTAAHLLEQLKEYSWVGRERGEMLPVDMTALAREVQAEIVVGELDASALEFEIQSLPPVRGNIDLLRCVLRNLMNNAAKFTRGQTPRRIQVAGVEGPQENTYTVTDNGIGFDPALAEKLFEPFERLAAEQGFEGSGLGLAIVARIIRRQQGRVWAASPDSGGAQFGFTLPTERR